MRWNIVVERVGEDGNQSAITLGTIERLAGSTTAENLGVNLQESKQIANRLQDTVVEQQLQEHCEQRRKCLTCGRLRPIKDYRKAADLLRMLLPPVGGTTHTTTRGRLIAVGERIDEEIRQEITENRKPDKPAKEMIIGIDGAFVKGRPPTDRANLEIITGRIEADAEPSKVFAVVRDQDGHAKQHVQALLRQRGRDLETKLRVVSDGEDGMRSLVGKLFNANEQHILDWYHIARRFEVIGKGLVYLPHIEDFEHRLSRHWHHLNRTKWKVWHGNLYGASIALSSFYDGVDIHHLAAWLARESAPRLGTAR